MDDKERIEFIMQEKNLSNVIFCAKTNIAPASLSHIISGRTKPTLPILRHIVAAFPDLNPEWVFMGIGEMYAAHNNSASSLSEQDSAPNSNGENREQMQTLNSGVAYAANTAAYPKEGIDAPPAPSGYRQGTQVFNFGNANDGGRQDMQNKIPQPSVSDIVHETIVTMQKTQRKIVEVRIFFDDGTFETFFSNK